MRRETRLREGCGGGWVGRGGAGWGWGVLGREAFGGRPRLGGEVRVIGKGKIREIISPPVREVLPEAPPQWQAFFEGAFAHAEERRAESVAVFWQRLRKCLEGGGGS